MGARSVFSRMSGADSVVYCSADGRFMVEVPERARRQIVGHCRRAHGDETGGILVGTYSGDLRSAKVTHVTGPARGSIATPTGFFRSVGGLQRWLDRLWSRGRGYYLGEWHWHPHADPAPSPMDHEQVQRIAGDERYACPETLLMVVGGDPAKHWKAVVQLHLRSGGVVSLEVMS